MISQSHWSSFAIDHRLQDRFTIEEATRDYAIGAEWIDNRLDQLYSRTASRPSTLDAVHGLAWVLARYRSRGDDFLGENLWKIFLALRAFQRLEQFDHRAEGRRWCFTLNIEPLLRFDRLEPAAFSRPMRWILRGFHPLRQKMPRPAFCTRSNASGTEMANCRLQDDAHCSVLP
jgi:hypothetical protein